MFQNFISFSVLILFLSFAWFKIFISVCSLEYLIEEFVDERVQGLGWELLVQWVGYTAPTWEKADLLKEFAEGVRELRARKVTEARDELARLQERKAKRRTTLEQTELLIARKERELDNASVRAACHGAPQHAVKSVTRPPRP